MWIILRIYYTSYKLYTDMYVNDASINCGNKWKNEKSKGYLFGIWYSNRLSHHCLCLAETQRWPVERGSFLVNRGASRCALLDWRSLAPGSWRPEVGSGGSGAGPAGRAELVIRVPFGAVVQLCGLALFLPPCPRPSLYLATLGYTVQTCL